MSRLSGMERSHLPDYSIGATVLVVAIALPFFVFTRAELAHRAGAVLIGYRLLRDLQRERQGTRA